MSGTVLGIDPGAGGALAIVADDATLVDLADMPVADGVVSPVLALDLIREWCDRYGVVLAVLERLHALPPKMGGSKANFLRGQNMGVLQTAIAAAGVGIEMPTPSAWKKSMHLTSDKDACRAEALSAWPDWADSFKRKKDVDRAEAALLAEWGRRLLVERGRA